MLLVTVLTMLADLIGQNVVRKLSLRTRGGLLGGGGGGGGCVEGEGGGGGGGLGGGGGGGGVGGGGGGWRCFAAKNIISK